MAGAVQRKVRKSVRERGRDARVTQDAVRRVLAIEVAGDLVELGEHGALRVRKQQLQRRERLLEGVARSGREARSRPSPVSAEISSDPGSRIVSSFASVGSRRSALL